jgi:hypothetical protein
MIQVNVDHQGRLTFFEAIPAQRLSSPVAATPSGLGAPLSTGFAGSVDISRCGTGVDIPGRIRHTRCVDRDVA